MSLLLGGAGLSDPANGLPAVRDYQGAADTSIVLPNRVSTDILLLIAQAISGTVTTPSNWTKIRSTSSGGPQCAVYTAPSSGIIATPDFPITTPGTSTWACLSITNTSGVDASAIIGIYTTVSNHINAPSVTAGQANDLLVSVCLCIANNGNVLPITVPVSQTPYPQIQTAPSNSAFMRVALESVLIGATGIRVMTIPNSTSGVSLGATSILFKL